LIIHLIRSRYGKNLRHKDCPLFSFPETLDIREFTMGDEIPGEYHLKAVASHIGPKVDGGHYIAFCKIEEEWWQFSDTECGQVKAEEVLHENFPVHKESEQTATFLMYSSTE
jgi:ubiquitin C-terminal hydrolase